ETSGTTPPSLPPGKRQEKKGLAPPLFRNGSAERAEEKLLVLDFDGGHLHQVGKKVSASDRGRVLGRLVVLADVLSLELPGEVHRQKPAGEPAQKREGVTDETR